MPRAFNGTTDLIHADAAHLTNGATAFTIAFWVKSAAKTFASMYAETKAGALGPFFVLSTDGTTGTKIEMEARDTASGSVDVFDGSAVIFDSTWHHVVVKQNASNVMRFFVDGVADGSFTRTALSNASAQVFDTLTFGATIRTTTAISFAGSLAHMATWSRELSVQEVNALAIGLLPSHLAPDHYWPFWGVDSPEADIGTGAHVAGTLTGTTQGAGGPPVGLSLLELAA